MVRFDFILDADLKVWLMEVHDVYCLFLQLLAPSERHINNSSHQITIFFVVFKGKHVSKFVFSCAQ